MGIESLFKMFADEDKTAAKSWGKTQADLDAESCPAEDDLFNARLKEAHEDMGVAGKHLNHDT